MAEAEALWTLLEQTGDPVVAAALKSVVAQADDRSLNRINPIAFAASHGLDEGETIRTLVHSAQHGLFDMAWSAVCPGCGGVLEIGSALRTLNRPEYLCAFCRRSDEPTLDERVEVTFTVNPRIRRIAGHEPDTLPLIAALALDGFSTALPVTLSRAAPLRFRLWKPGDALIRGQMNIAEPPPEATEVEPDLLFAPLAAFDRSGHRIGYGAGHYDRAIAVLRGRKPVHAVGVAFATSEVEAIPSEPHDEALDAILTETETIFPRGAP